jgi:hypothetical protein
MSTPESNPTPEPEQKLPNNSAIDLQKLAEKVYRLMLADIRLERARGVPTTRSKRQ